MHPYTGVWTHVVAAMAGDGTMRLFKNGVEVCSKTGVGRCKLTLD